MDRQERTAAETTAEREAYRRILVGTDGSACSVRAASHAVYLARELGARLYALNSVNVERAFRAGIHFTGAVTELERAGRDATAAVKAMADASGVECEEILSSGNPHKAIIEASEEVDADLIVVGSTGLTSLERALIGSESESLMRLSRRPVLLVREACRGPRAPVFCPLVGVPRTSGVGARRPRRARQSPRSPGTRLLVRWMAALTKRMPRPR